MWLQSREEFIGARIHCCRCVCSHELHQQRQQQSCSDDVLPALDDGRHDGTRIADGTPTMLQAALGL
jgi:hypothetical protein